MGNLSASGGGDGAIQDGVTSTIEATVLDYTNSNPLAVRLTDTAGDYVGAGAGTQYTEDAAAAADPIGTVLILVRDDTPLAGSLTTAEGDNVAARGTNSGELYVKHVDAIPVTDNSGSLTIDNVALANVGGGFETVALRVTIASDSTGVLSVDDNAGALTVDWAGTAPPIGAGTESAALRVTLATDSTGLVSVDDNSGTLTVDNTALTTADLDTGIGTDTRGVIGILGSASGGGTIVPAGGGIEATALRVTIASDSTGVLSVDDNGGAITVDWAGTAPPIGAGTEAAALRVTIATDSTGVLSIDDNDGAITVDGSLTTVTTVTTVSTVSALGVGTTGPQKAEDVAHATGDMGIAAFGTANEANTARAADNDYVPFATDVEGNTRIVGNRDHDAVDAGEIVGAGGRAIAHGTNPTAVAAADRTAWYFNRAGVPFTIGGHPNIVTIELAATAAQTDVAIVTVAGGLKIVVTQIQMTADNANTVDVGFRVGFGATTTPTTTGVVLTHPGVAAGSGISRGDGSGILGVGADGEDLRVTSEVPTTGSIRILVSYFTIES